MFAAYTNVGGSVNPYAHISASMPRLLRILSAVLMIVGGLPLAAWALALLRDLLGRRGFDLIPNVAPRPEALIIGAGVFVLGAFMRRRLHTHWMAQGGVEADGDSRQYG